MTLNKKLVIILFAGILVVSVLSGYYLTKMGQSDGNTNSTQKTVPTLTLTANTTTPKLTDKIALTATLSEPVNGQVTLEWAIKSSEFRYRTNETIQNGVFTRDFGFNTPGEWKFRVYWSGDSELNDVYSEIVTVNVIP
ncbi:MAG: hypothetical protein ACQCN5_07435 [Candidatus Bathyarchaeia archaeon]|jgi:predicted secreted protein